MTMTVLTQPECSLSASVSPLKQCVSEAQADRKDSGYRQEKLICPSSPHSLVPW